MPVLNGIELARIIKEEYPKITVIAMSGFEQEHSLNTQHDIKGLFATFIGKPFTSKQLSEIIQKCRLDSSSVSET
jgi:YesN/AraC family two-component response regulator